MCSASVTVFTRTEVGVSIVIFLIDKQLIQLQAPACTKLPQRRAQNVLISHVTQKKCFDSLLRATSVKNEKVC